MYVCMYVCMNKWINTGLETESTAFPPLRTRQHPSIHNCTHPFIHAHIHPSIPCHKASSEYLSKGSKFDRMVPENKTGSYDVMYVCMYVCMSNVCMYEGLYANAPFLPIASIHAHLAYIHTYIHPYLWNHGYSWSKGRQTDLRNIYSINFNRSLT